MSRHHTIAARTPLALALTLALGAPITQAAGVGDLAGALKGADSGSFNIGMGTRVRGHSSSGEIATPSNVANATNWAVSTINTQILQVGRGLGELTQQQSGLIKKSFEHQNETLKRLFTAFGKAQQRAENERLYGARSRPLASCAEPDLGRTLGAAAQDEQARGKAGNAETRDYLTRYPSYSARIAELGQRLSEGAIDGKSADQIFGGDNGAVDPDDPASKEALARLINPVPAPKLDEKLEQTQSGQRYELMRRMSNERYDLAGRTLNEIQASHSATVEIPEAVRQGWSESGGQGPIPGTIGDRISPRALLDAQVRSRYANVAWRKSLYRVNEKGVLHEIALELSTQNELQRRQLVLLERIAALMAQDRAERVRGDSDGALQTYYNKALSEQQTRVNATE